MLAIHALFLIMESKYLSRARNRRVLIDCIYTQALTSTVLHTKRFAKASAVTFYTNLQYSKNYECDIFSMS